MKQILGTRKHRQCEVIGQRAYRVCYTSGHFGHGRAECWFGDNPNAVRDADWIDLRAKTVKPKIRDGALTDTGES